MNAELEGAELDAAVARLEGELVEVRDGKAVHPQDLWPYEYRYSTDWQSAGPIIEREQISLIRQTLDWCADMRGVECQFASEPLVAAMRAYVRSKTPNG
jgi:hypothetical protein